MKNKNLKVIEKSVDSLIPYCRNARVHDDAQVVKIMDSIRTFGFTNPILTDDASGIVAGHGRLLAAKRMGLMMVPTIALEDLTEEEKKAYILADNKIAEMSSWDKGLLGEELDILSESMDVSALGFDLDEFIKTNVDKIEKLSKRIETDDVNDRFWINVTGPISFQPEVLEAFKALAEKNDEISISMGTVTG